MKDFCIELRTLIDQSDIAVLPGIFDGFSARLVEQYGFKAGYISGAGLSESHLGWADVGIMGLGELGRDAVALCEAIAQAGKRGCFVRVRRFS